MEQQKISIKEIVELCKKYYAGKIDKEDLDEFGNKIIVKSYISLLEKTGLAMTILTQSNYSKDEDISTKIAEMIMNKFFYCLLGAYTNIEIEEEYVTLINYDLIAPLFKKFILQFCQDDYKELEDMVRDIIQVGNLEQLISIFSNIDSNTLQKANEDLKQNITSLKENEKLIDNIRDIASFNDPIMNKLLDQMKDKAIKEVNVKK